MKQKLMISAAILLGLASCTSQSATNEHAVGIVVKIRTTSGIKSWVRLMPPESMVYDIGDTIKCYGHRVDEYNSNGFEAVITEVTQAH